MIRRMKSYGYSGVAATICGKIYVVSGSRENGRTLESVDSPESDEWRSVEPMSTKRCGASCVSLNDELDVLGGHDGADALTSCEKDNPEKGMWTITPRMLGGAAVVDGKILVIGGLTALSVHNFCPTDSVKCFGPARSEWSDRKSYFHPFKYSLGHIRYPLLSYTTLVTYAHPDRDKLPEETRIKRRRLQSDVRTRKAA